MSNKKEMTVPVTPVLPAELKSASCPRTEQLQHIAVDEEQSNHKEHREIITNSQKQINQQATQKCNHPLNKSMDEGAMEYGVKLGYKKLNTISMTELYDTVYPPRTPIVDGFLYGGIYLFVGAPKVGKSFFMAQLAYHVAMGISLWDYPVHAGTVLYLALEDDYARLQQRLFRMFGVESADKLYLATKARSLNEGLDQELEEFVNIHKDARLVIIDTLQKVREVGGDRYSYSSDYEIVTRLKGFSDKYGICLLVVHHTRKLESEDSFDMISGTNGLLGAADGAFIMQKKKRTDNVAVLDVVGREQPDQELTIEFDRKRCIWNFKKKCMKNIQISYDLFVSLLKYHLMDDNTLEDEIRQGLEEKMDAIVRRELYEQYKTAPTKEEREKQEKCIWISAECVTVSDGKD